MARRLRLQFPGARYHVINRGNLQYDLFVSFGVVRDSFEGERSAEEVLREAAAAGGIVGGEGGFAGVDRKTAVAPVLQLGDLPVGERAGVAQAAQDGVAPEFASSRQPPGGAR